jgi:hypothetical protein
LSITIGGFARANKKEEGSDQIGADSFPDEVKLIINGLPVGLGS